MKNNITNTHTNNSITPPPPSTKKPKQAYMGGGDHMTTAYMAGVDHMTTTWWEQHPKERVANCLAILKEISNLLHTSTLQYYLHGKKNKIIK